MKAGDIAVHAAGVSHKNVESSADYLYMGLYPKVMSDLPTADEESANDRTGCTEVEQQLVQG